MPPKQKTQQDRVELRNSVVSILRDDLLNEFKTTLRNELKETIRSEIKTVLRAERFAQIESRLAQLATLHTKLQDMEYALNFHCKMVDDIRNTDLPALASHLEKVASGLALQTLNLDVHSRKWSLTIQGIKGEADEDEATTRHACADLARSHLKITDATGDDFSACHRLNRKKEVGIIIRFKDLSRRNRWLDEAKNLRTHPDKISISPALPPVIRPLKSELLQARKNLPADQKRRSFIKYLRQWPYVELSVPNSQPIRPSSAIESAVTEILGFNPLCTIKPNTD